MFYSSEPSGPLRATRQATGSDARGDVPLCCAGVGTCGSPAGGSLAPRLSSTGTAVGPCSSPALSRALGSSERSPRAPAACPGGGSPSTTPSAELFGQRLP